MVIFIGSFITAVYLFVLALCKAASKGEHL